MPRTAPTPGPATILVEHIYPAEINRPFARAAVALFVGGKSLGGFHLGVHQLAAIVQVDVEAIVVRKSFVIPEFANLVPAAAPALA